MGNLLNFRQSWNATDDTDDVSIQDNEVRMETCALLKVASTHSTEEHKVGGAFGGEDAHYLLDLDMAILGSSPEAYADYREKIRGEYSFLSEPMYTALRLKVLETKQLLRILLSLGKALKNFQKIPKLFCREFRKW